MASKCRLSSSSIQAEIDGVCSAVSPSSDWMSASRLAESSSGHTTRAHRSIIVDGKRGAYQRQVTSVTLVMEFGACFWPSACLGLARVITRQVGNRIYYVPSSTYPPEKHSGGASLLCGAFPEFLKHPADFRVGHKVLPHQTGPVVLNHDHDRRLIQPHGDGCDPVRTRVKRIAWTVDIPHLTAEVTVEVLECGHRCLRRVRERSQCSRRRERSTVVEVVGSVRHISIGTVTGGQSPGIGAVTAEMLWIRDRISAIDQSDIAIVFARRFREAIVKAVGIETHERVVCEKQWAPGADPDVELDPKISVPVAVVVTLLASGPTFAIGDCGLRLSDPSRVIKRCGHRVRGRGDAQQV